MGKGHAQMYKVLCIILSESNCPCNVSKIPDRLPSGFHWQTLFLQMLTEQEFIQQLGEGIPSTLPPPSDWDASVSHAPVRNLKGVLTREEKKLALINALRYFPTHQHAELAQEFAQELETLGRIYMYRFRPNYAMMARPIDHYGAKTPQAAAIMLMIQNNLDPKVAKHPHELITYGGNGAVFQNWAQYRLVMYYLQRMTEEQTLVIYSGHPLGLFPSHPDAPRVIVTNGMMIPNYSTKDDWNKYNALGVTQYGQMTAGSFMYIGPQGIVHGTTITLLNAGRLKGLGADSLQGRLFITSGLGGMSGAQSIAAVIAGCVGIIAEVDPDAIEQRLLDGYIQKEHVYSDLASLFLAAEQYKKKQGGVAFIYSGNIVDVWEYCVAQHIHVDLGSDQTSLHNIDDLGYCPCGYTFQEAKILLQKDKEEFIRQVQSTLRRHVDAINQLHASGMYFWDYGNAFLKEAGAAGADIWKKDAPHQFRYPSYVEDIMGPLCFDYGFGPFRWVCTSGNLSDLELTDRIAADVIQEMLKTAPADIHPQLQDNLNWIREAGRNLPVVGSMSRILYADAECRIRIAQAFNTAIADGRISQPIVLGRDHHDVSGTDSPFRETSNIYDGSSVTADMAVQNFAGDACRGATWISLHNGGGTGWGTAINGGFGMVIDGSSDAERRLKSMLHWDVNNGIARRSWARNPHAMQTIQRAMESEPRLQVTIPELVDPNCVDELFLS